MNGGNGTGANGINGGSNFDIKPGDIAIAVMGTTGVGKSTFISLFASREDSPQIGRTLSSCTAEVRIYKCKLDSVRSFYLIDTPGFDDSRKSDADVLKDLAAWLIESYGHGILLTGIIYLHPINHSRVGGTAKQNLLMFKRLCGENAYPRVALATTFWDQADLETGRRREIELMTTDDFWRRMIDKGSKVFRHDDFSTSARCIIEHIISKRTRGDLGIKTDLQIQMVEQGMRLDQTAAGSTLQSQLLALEANYEKKMLELKKELSTAISLNNNALKIELEADRRKFEVERARNEAERLKLLADKDQLTTHLQESQARFEREAADRGDTIQRWEYEMRIMQHKNVADAEKRELKATLEEEKRRRQDLVSRIRAAQSCTIM